MFRSVYGGVKSRPLLVVLAAVFAGLAMLLVAGAAVSGQPLVLLAAVPLAMTAGLMWWQGTGRMTASLFGRGTANRRRSRRFGRRGADPRTTDGGPSRTGAGGSARASGSDGDDASSSRTVGGDPWERSFDEEAQRERRYRARRQARRTADGDDESSASRGAWDKRRARRNRPDRLGGMTEAEAYDVLGLDPSASEEAVTEAYREQAKTAHPDTDGGSSEEFQELNDAYERIVEE